MRKKGHWLRAGTAEKLNDYYNPTKRLHAHTIDAAQQGFYKACVTTKAIKRFDPGAKYPHWRKKFRTTIWKTTALTRDGNTLILSNGKGNPKIDILLPATLSDCVRVLEVRLVYDKLVKHRMPHNLRLMRRCQDTGQSQRL